MQTYYYNRDARSLIVGQGPNQLSNFMSWNRLADVVAAHEELKNERLVGFEITESGLNLKFVTVKK